MENFQDKFINEATDLIHQIENSLLLLEDKPDDTNLLEEILRGMHTLKGAGSMYGFNNISELTHLLESLFEFVRDGKLPLSEFFLSTILIAVDHLKKELQSKEDNPVLRKMYSDLQSALLQFVPKDAKLKERVKKTDTSRQKNEKATFYIKITPFADIDERGVNLNQILDNIQQAGVAKMFMYPSSDEATNNNNFYLYWEVLLSTELSLNSLDDIFLFIEDEVEMVKISTEYLLSVENFTQKLLPFEEQGEAIGKEKAIEMARSIEIELEKKRSEAKQKKDNQRQLTEVVKVDSIKLDELMNLLSELVTTKEEMKLLIKKSGYKNLYKTLESVEKLTRRFHENIFDIRLVSLETTALQFRRLIRDLAVELNKDVEFITEGLDTKLDKTIVDKLKNPLMHILRNSIDHGIEKNETRIESGKNPKGKIHFRAYYSGNYVHIEVTDDGAGINLEKVRQTAIIKGYITENQQLTEKEILDLTFYQGFTTTDKVSAVSGRGVGMDVVKRDVSNLRGEIEVSTQKGQGTKILIKIPLSLSIIDTMLVVVAETYFAIPLLYVANCWRTTQNELDSSTDKHITINNERIPYVELRKVFKIGDEAPSRRRVVVVKTGDFAAAFLVDRIIGEHQAVLKPLGKYFADYDYLSGVSLLADGSLAMIIEAGKIIYDHTRNLSTV